MGPVGPREIGNRRVSAHQGHVGTEISAIKRIAWFRLTYGFRPAGQAASTYEWSVHVVVGADVEQDDEPGLIKPPKDDAAVGSVARGPAFAAVGAVGA